MYSLLFHRQNILPNIYRNKSQECWNTGLLYGKETILSYTRPYLFEEKKICFDRVFDRTRSGYEHRESFKNVNEQKKW